MVGSSNEISREICRRQAVDSLCRQIGEWGPLHAEWSGPGWQDVVVDQGERISGIGTNWLKRPTGVRVLIVAKKPCSKTRWSEGE